MTASKADFRRLARKTTGDGEKLFRRIMEHPWFFGAKTIMAYCAIAPEPDITPVLEEILAQGKTLLLPRCEEDGIMTARLIDDLAALKPGAFGILEPPPDSAVFPPEDIDLILVPGLAFDRRCCRLGRGKGYYDRFISSQKTMGICGCLLPEIPVEAHDKPMDAVMTENEILYGLEETHV